jgi:hypothetical protein
MTPVTAGYMITLDAGPHPAEVQIFSDPMSIGHVGWGILAAVVPSPYREALLMAFTGYQVSQTASGESWQRTGGEFIELALGLVAGAFAMRYAKWR